MDALEDSNKVEAWLKQLGDLSGQIEVQATLAAKTAGTTQITLYSNDWTGFRTQKDDVGMPFASEFMPNDALRNDPPKMATEPSTLAATKRQKRPWDIIELAAEGCPPKKRSRNMTDGYYDGLEVKRTMVAEIKRPAEADVLDGRIDNGENDLEELPSPGSVSTGKGRFSALYPTPPPSPESEGAKDSSLDLSVKDDTEKFEAAEPDGRSTHLLDAEAPPGIIEVNPDYALSELIPFDLKYRSTQHMGPGNPHGWVVAARTF